MNFIFTEFYILYIYFIFTYLTGLALIGTPEEEGVTDFLKR